jgi:hypothetical protein
VSRCATAAGTIAHRQRATSVRRTRRMRRLYIGSIE